MYRRKHDMHDDHPCAHSPSQVSSTKCRAGYRAETRQTFFSFFFFFVFYFFSILGCSKSEKISASIASLFLETFLLLFFPFFPFVFSFSCFFSFFSRSSRRQNRENVEKVPAVKMKIFLCENSIFDPRWTGGEGNRPRFRAFFFHVFLCFKLNVFLLFSFFLVFPFKYVSLQASVSEFNFRCSHSVLHGDVVS